MAVTDAYATAADFRTFRKINGNSGFNSDANILEQLTAISRYIETTLGDRDGPRFFTQDASPVARIYYPRNFGRRLKVHDIASASGISIKVDINLLGHFDTYTAWVNPVGNTPGDYQLLPLNAGVGPEPRPYTFIHVPWWSTQQWFTPQIPVQVTAQWGWPAVPYAIKHACIELTAIFRLQSPRANQSVNEVGDVLSQSPLAQAIVQRLIANYSEPTI